MKQKDLCEARLDKLVEITIPGNQKLKIPSANKKIYKNFECLSAGYISNHIFPGGRCVDVGANFGFYSKVFSKLVGDNGSVYAFEPSPATLEILNLNVKNVDNVKIVPMAASLTSGISDFYHTKDFVNSGSFAMPPFQSKSDIKHLYVPTVSLDEYFDASICLNFLKIDIQGDDIKALLGAQKIIERSSNIKCLVEWAPYWLQHAGYEIEALPETLLQLGFKNLVVLDDWLMKERSTTEFISEYMVTKNNKRFCNLFAEK